MNTDQIFVAGLVVGALAILSFLSALTNGRRPYVAVVALLVGAGMVALAVLKSPGVYSIATIPDAVYRVIATVADIGG
jgi:F0F1-type ATP synthase assembly protein I